MSTVYYLCSQSECLADYKQSNRKRIMRFKCEGQLQIRINLLSGYACIMLTHNYLHKRPENSHSIPENICMEIRQNIHLEPLQLRKYLTKKFDLSDITPKQIYYCWSSSTQSAYKFDDDPVKSAVYLLKNVYQSQNCELIMEKNTSDIVAIAFSTPILKYAQQIEEAHVDATYKTAKGRFELYGVVGEINGSGFPLAYCLMDTSRHSGNNESIRTQLLIEFFQALRNRSLIPKFIFTDKDFAEINAAQLVWRNSQTRLCLWHIKRAILTRLRSKKEQQRFAYIKESDLKRFPFIDPTFRPIPGSTSLFCPVSLHKSVVTLIERHFNLHPLIPIDMSGGSLTPDQIHYNSTKEVYDFCRLNDLSALWLYLFSCWYSEGKYSLWAHSCHPQIPFSKTTMMIEAHWKVLKRDYLYRFNRPRLDYVIYIICEHLLPQQENRLLHNCHSSDLVYGSRDKLMQNSKR